MQDESDEQLAATFVEIARGLEAAQTPDETQARITRAAVDTVPGCAHASISMVPRFGPVTTVAPTDDVPAKVDTIQYETGEGPCLEAIRDDEVVLIDDLTLDERWPRFGARAVAETPVRSILAVRLFVQDDTIGALNLFAGHPHSFDDHDEAVATILAGHAALAVSAARDKQQAEQLDRALQSNREIGVAMGVIMARGGLTREQAFHVLREASQRLNVKLRDLAADVVDTGQVPSRGHTADVGD